MTVSRLLKSCAMPPANRPTASIFCDWRSWSSSRLRSVTSVMTATTPAGDPSGPARGDVAQNAGGQGPPTLNELAEGNFQGPLRAVFVPARHFPLLIRSAILYRRVAGN